MLFNKVKQYIHQHGYVTLSDYMALCLYDRNDGYYKTRACIGAQGDFITAPEISQLFGETVALWLLTQWQQQPIITPRYLIELGPGCGTLMADILRIIHKVNPYYFEHLAVHLVETSSALRQQQQQKLASYSIIKWHEDLAGLLYSLDHNPCYIVANEFFDALPITQLQWHNHTWYQRVIKYCKTDCMLYWDLEPYEGHTPFQDDYPLPRQGEILEFSIQQLNHFNLICTHLNQGPHTAVIVDYGYGNFIYGDSLQALHHHQYSNPLAQLGHSDLTSHVNFAALRKQALDNNLGVTLQTQAQFLKSYGIDALLQKLLQVHPHQAAMIQNGYDRLVDDRQMGELFKVLVLNNKNRV